MHKTHKTHKSHPLSDRHFRKVICCPDDTQQRLESVWAITWRPGDTTDSFLGKELRPRTSPVCLVQSSNIARTGAKANGKQRENIHYIGYSTQVNPTTGELLFGGETANCFAYDFGFRPHPGATGRIVNVEANPALVYTGLEMYAARQRAVCRNYKLATVPRLPACYLGFYKDSLPEMEDTPALRLRVARAMRKPIEAIQAMSLEILTPFLRAEWPTCFTPPAHVDNSTGLYLISHQLCSQFSRALRDYLCFRELMGAELYNPIRSLLPRLSKGRCTTIPNPAKSVIIALGYNPAAMTIWGTDPAHLDEAGEPLRVIVGGWAETLSEEGQAALIKGMRTALGDFHELFSDDEILELVVTYKTAVVLPTATEPLVVYGEELTLRLMRQHCGPYAHCCRDEDLLAAARHPNRPLLAAGLVRVQALYAPQRIGAYYKFTSEELGRHRVQADFISVRTWWRRVGTGATTGRRKP